MMTIIEHIQTQVDASAAQLIEITQSLVQAKSENPPGDVINVADIAANLIRQLIPECKISVHDTAPGIRNVVAVLQGRSPGKILVFSGHLDTFPAGDESRWSYGPFAAQLSEDGKRLFGRGVSDMKGGIASSIVAASILAKYNEFWSGQVVLAFAGDEETMGTLGSDYLLENVPEVSCDAMICGDAGSPLIVRTGEKGFVWIELHTAGKAAHGAHVHRGENAIEKLLKALAVLKELEELPTNNPEIQAVISNAKPVSEPLGGVGEADVLQRVTVNIGKITGGTSINLVPDQASASADIRIPMGISVKVIIDQLTQKLEGLAEIKILRTAEPSWTSVDEAIVKHTLNATKMVISDDAVVNMRVGASDSRLFRRRGIPTVLVGLTPYNMGGPDEYIQVEELGQVCKIHTRAALEFLST